MKVYFVQLKVSINFIAVAANNSDLISTYTKSITLTVENIVLTFILAQATGIKF